MVSAMKYNLSTLEIFEGVMLFEKFENRTPLKITCNMVLSPVLINQCLAIVCMKMLE